MSATLVDTNVFVDILSQDPEWQEWSEIQLRNCAKRGPAVVNVVIYAELAARLTDIALLDSILPESDYVREDIPFGAAFLTGLAYIDYKRRGGARTSPLPDFFIGAHAAVRGYTLLTRDAHRYRTYFPKLKIIAP